MPTKRLHFFFLLCVYHHMSAELNRWRQTGRTHLRERVRKHLRCARTRGLTVTAIAAAQYQEQQHRHHDKYERVTVSSSNTTATELRQHWCRPLGGKHLRTATAKRPEYCVWHVNTAEYAMHVHTYYTTDTRQLYGLRQSARACPCETCTQMHMQTFR